MATVVPTPFGPVDIDTGEAQAVSGAAIFNPAIRGVFADSGDPLIVLALDDVRLLCVNNNGQLGWYDAAEVILDWRYNYQREEWVDGAGVSLEAGEGE